jgi:serine/threonine-protein kinase HipA
MYKQVSAIEVRIWDKRVGAAAFDPMIGYYAFEYDPLFKKTGIELAPLAMPLAKASAPFIFPDLSKMTFKLLPAMLADALPDDFGNALIDAWMTDKGLSKSNITSLDRLAYMGKRGIGALEFRPMRSPARENCTALKLSTLIESARLAVQGNFNSDAMAKAALSQIIQVGTSAGGARAKAAIAWNAQTSEIKHGQFDIEPDFEHWLLKFDGVGPDFELGISQEYGRIEYAYYLMAAAAGIDMSLCRLMEENGRAHFMTRRFDRDGSTKHHLQTLCAIAGLDYKQRATHGYSQLFSVVDELQLPYSDKEEAFRRMAFNIMAANCDDHTKNISFILRQGEAWRLAPAYDLTHAYNPRGKWTYQHLMSVNGKFENITSIDLLLVAERFGIGTAPKVLKQVAAAVSDWADFATTAGVSQKEIERVSDDICFIR